MIKGKFGLPASLATLLGGLIGPRRAVRHRDRNDRSPDTVVELKAAAEAKRQRKAARRLAQRGAVDVKLLVYIYSFAILLGAFLLLIFFVKPDPREEAYKHECERLGGHVEAPMARSFGSISCTDGRLPKFVDWQQ